MARFLPALRDNTKTLIGQYETASLGSLNQQQKAIVGAYLGAVVSQLAAEYGGRRPRRWEVERAVAEGYERIVWVYKAVDAIAGNCAALPFQLLDGDTPVTDHPLLDLLNGSEANPLETGHEFRERLSAQLLLSRRGVFVEVVMSRRNTPMRVDLLPPGRTQPVPGDRDEPIRGYLVTLADGKRVFMERERVLWFRKPHPTDPYSSITPLEAAGLATELDFFADLYNARFMQNDGRPGGILAVKNSSTGASMSEPEMDRIERRFGRGPVEAGKMSVISGDMSFIDPAGKPRDVAYGELSDRAKTKILTAFGLDESIVGDTSGKTFANAEQAWENFWLLDPMPAHMRLVSNGWRRLPGLEELTPGFDVSEVEPLRRGKAARLDEARAEVAAGLRTIKSYATLAGYGDEIADTPHTHALWLPQGLIPIASRQEDIHALDDQNPSLGSQAAAKVGAEQGAPVPGGAGPTAPGAGGGSGPAAIGGPAVTPPRALPSASATPPSVAASGPPRPRTAQEIVGRNVKALPTRPRPRLAVTPAEPAHASEADDEASRAAEDALANALAVLADRFVERTVARLQSPRQRKGTRHWEPQYERDTRLGVKALDTARVVDEDTWASDAQTVAEPYVQAAATQAANAAAGDLDPEGHPVLDTAITAAAVAAALDLVAASARRQAQRLAAVLNIADQAGQSLEDMVKTVRSWGGRLTGWARGVATQATVAVIEGSRSATVQALIASGAIDPTAVRRTWITRMDERVRPSHRRAQGQAVRLGVPFAVGNALLRYPGDPLGPPEETANCRCKVLLTVGSVSGTVTVRQSA